MSARRVCVREVIGQQQAAALRDNEPATTDDDDGHCRRSCAFFARRPPPRPLFTLPLPPVGEARARTHRLRPRSPRGWGKRRRGRARAAGDTFRRRRCFPSSSRSAEDVGRVRWLRRGSPGYGWTRRRRRRRRRRGGRGLRDATPAVFFSLPAPARPSAAAGGHAASTIYLLPYCCTRDVKIARVCDSATRVCTPPLPPCRHRRRQSLAASRGRVLIPCARGAFPPRVCTRVI